MNAARDAFQRLGGNLTEIYAEIVPPQLAHLAVELESLDRVYVLNELDRAIARDANLDLTWPRWALWLFDEELKKFKTSAPIAALFRRVLVGDLPTNKEWEKARSVSADALISSTAKSWEMAANAAMSAANASVDADSASWVAWEASTVSGGSGHRMAKKLKNLLKDTP